MDIRRRAFRSHAIAVGVEVMAANKMWYLVSYDIRDAKRLRSVARKMEGYGCRLQYSVFRARLTKRQLERLVWELKQVLDSEDDLLIVGLCAQCVTRVAKRNESAQWAREKPATYRIV